MKKAIRKWLGIEDDLSRLSAVEELSLNMNAKLKNDQELRDMVAEAFKLALLGAKEEAEWTGFGGWRSLKFHGNALTELIEKASSSQAKTTAQKTVDDFVAQEKFIDEIVDRIKRKQL